MGITNQGKSDLLSSGWVPTITHAFAKTAGGSGFSTTVSMVFTGGYLQPTADIVFSIGAGVNDVETIELGYYDSILWVPVWTDSFRDELGDPISYDFPTAGTLTVSSLEINATNAYIQALGKQALFETGLESVITQAKLYTSGDALVDTQSVSFSESGGAISPTASIIFNVTGGTNNVAYVQLFDASNNLLYKRPFATTYNYATTGTHTIPTWSISL